MPRTRRFVVPPLGSAVVALTLTVSACGGPEGRTDPRPPGPAPASTATAQPLPRQVVEDLLADVTVGDTIPVDTLRSRLSAAVTEAGSWRVQFDDVWPVEVTAVLDQAGAPAVRIHGLDEDDPESETRLLGDALYALDRRHAGGPRWVVSTRDDANELLRLTEEEVQDLLVIGSPLVLLGALGSGDATVLERSGGEVTLSVRMDHGAFTRVVGAGPPSGPGPAPSTWVVDRGLPVLVRSELGGTWEPELRFSRWGGAGPVGRPPAHLVETMEEHLILENQRRLPG